ERMPPDHRLSDEQILLIKSWISLGAMENDCPVPACDSVNVTYSKQVSLIIQGNCLGCHASGNVALSSYDNVKAQVVSGALLGSIRQTGSFPPMPQGYKLSDCDIRTIEKWINAGALDN
ncbi:MAG: c-type cytochrome domain-containing protein, partial [Bacteroidia bacterium]